MTNEWRKEVLNRHHRDAAILKILKVLKSPMMVMSKPNRDEALTLAEQYSITVTELITAWSNMAMRV